MLYQKKHNNKHHKFDNNIEKKIIDIHLPIKDITVWNFVHDGQYVY